MTTTCINNILSECIKNFKNDPKTPKKIDWRVFNPQKDLVPLSKSGKVFLNRNPKRVNRKWEKEMPEGFDLFYVGNLPLFRLSGMIYWYAIGDFQFDIRDMRLLAKLPKQDYLADHNHESPNEGLILVAQQLDKALKGVESHYDFFGTPPPPKKIKAHYGEFPDDELPF
jgi:hypothetical protein